MPSTAWMNYQQQMRAFDQNFPQTDGALIPQMLYSSPGPNLIYQQRSEQPVYDRERIYFGLKDQAI